MLPVPYFHITVTVPAELRAVLRTHQRDGYAVLMQATAGAIIELARDPRFVGGTVAVLAVLHTWDQQINFHPHVHCLVSGGGVSERRHHLASGAPRFLLPIKALARKVRGKFRALLRRRCPDLIVPDVVWRKHWIAHVTAWGRGEQAVLDYLARYVFRIAITNARIVGLDDAGSPSRTATARPVAGAHAGSAARSSCAASSSTCCRAASTRSATSRGIALGISLTCESALARFGGDRLYLRQIAIAGGSPGWTSLSPALKD